MTFSEITEKILSLPDYQVECSTFIVRTSHGWTKAQIEVINGFIEQGIDPRKNRSAIDRKKHAEEVLKTITESPERLTEPFTPFQFNEFSIYPLDE